MIGKGFTRFPGTTVEELMEAMQNKTTQADGMFMNLQDHAVIAAPNLWKSMIVHPTYKVKRALARRMAGRRSGEFVISNVSLSSNGAASALPAIT